MLIEKFIMICFFIVFNIYDLNSEILMVDNRRLLWGWKLFNQGYRSGGGAVVGIGNHNGVNTCWYIGKVFVAGLRRRKIRLNPL
jgi:hypothetical protein